MPVRPTISPAETNSERSGLIFPVEVITPFMHIRAVIDKNVADQLRRLVAHQQSAHAPIHIQVEDCSMKANVLACSSERGSYEVKCAVIGRDQADVDASRVIAALDHRKRLPPMVI
jgi:hypothetical protein